MGRLELVYTCVENLVDEYAERNGTEGLPERLLKYMEDGNKNATIYRAKGMDVGARLVAAVADAFAIKVLCGGGAGGSRDYALLSRMLEEQTEGSKRRPARI